MIKIDKTEIGVGLGNKQAGAVLIIYTGGTFGMSYNIDGILVPFDFSQILEKIPKISDLNLSIEVHSFRNPIDSANINPDHWQTIATVIFENYDRFDGFVVLHGTDTMAYTSSALSYMLQGLRKPVILTGAQIPIGAVRSDARENLITSLLIASKKEDGESVVQEVCIYFSSWLLRGNRARKLKSSKFQAFESENHPALAVAGIYIDYDKKALYRSSLDKLELQIKFETKVSIIKLYPGIDKEILKSILTNKALKGIVLETYGSGNAPLAEWFISLLKESIENGLIVFNVSQCIGGRVIPDRYETGKILERINVISGADITVEAAITKLMFLLGNENNAKEVKLKLAKSVSGELF